MAVTKTGGPTAKLYRGQLFPLDTKDVKGEFDKRKKDKLKANKADSEPRETGAPMNDWPGVSGSGEPQPDKSGVVNDEKSAAKGQKEAEKAEKEADKGAKKNA